MADEQGKAAGGTHHAPGAQAEAEASRVDVGSDQSVRDWAGRWGVTPDDVRDAVAAVGDRPEAVREYLHAHKWAPGK